MANSKETHSVRGRVENNKPNPVDVHAGSRMRLRRQLLGYSQQFMARKLGLTFQQVQKYEKGCNRIGASRLWDIAKTLDVPMDYFFTDMDKATENQSPMMLITPDTKNDFSDKEKDVDPMKRQETLELIRAYYRITNRHLAKILFCLIITMSKSNSTMPDDEDEGLS